MRVLEQHGVAYTTFTFSPEIHSALGVAEAVGVPPETVYKTLVVLRPDGRPLLAVIPGPASLDLKALAAATGVKKLSMASHTEAEHLTGLKVGGISPLALLHKRWPVVLDASAESYEAILISAGQRGVNLRVPVAGLKQVLAPQIAAVAQWDEQGPPEGR
ncbi:MAG: aminoacyl-tRNA deacylase [Anaerolineae bacterium]|nr:aminoacyl-tRNA deacylase [Anaerolineae bacterium]